MRLFLTLPLLLTLLVNPSLADDGDEERSQPAVNQIQINGSSILIYGNELIKNKRDKVFFAAESSSEMIEVPFTEDGDDFLEVILPYEPSAGTYRLGIGKSQKQLRVSELITFVTDTPESNRYTADCTEDSSAFTTLVESSNRPTAGFTFLKVIGDCEVQAPLRFSARNIFISGTDEAGECSGRLVNRDSPRFEIRALNGAQVYISCLELDPQGEVVAFESRANSYFSLQAVTSPPAELYASVNSSFRVRDNNTSIQLVISRGQSRVLTRDMDYLDGAILWIYDDSDLTILGGSGRIGTLEVDNGSSADLKIYNLDDTQNFPPEVDQALITFDSRLRTLSPVFNANVDDTSTALLNGNGSYDP